MGPGHGDAVGAGAEVGKGVGGGVGPGAGDGAAGLAPVIAHPGAGGGDGGPAAAEDHADVAIVQHHWRTDGAGGEALHVVGAVGVDELHWRHLAVDVVAGLEAPGQQVAEVGGLPVDADEVGHVTAVEQVVVAGEAALGTGRHQDGSAVDHVEDVVAQAHIGGIGLHVHTAATHLLDGVVVEALAVVAGVAAADAGRRAIAPQQVVAHQAVAAHVHADGVVVDAVVPDGGPADVDAGGVAERAVAHHLEAASRDAGGALPDGVALDARVGAADAGAGGPHGVAAGRGLVVDVDAGADIVHTVAFDQRAVIGLVAAAVGVDAGGLAVHLVAGDAQARGVAGVDALAAVVVHGVAGHPAVVDVLAQVDAARRVAGDLGVEQAEAVRPAVVVDDEAPLPAAELEVLDGDIGGAGQHHGVLAAVGVAAEQLAVAVDRADDAHAGIARTQGEVGDQVVAAGVHQHGVARVDVVGAEQRRQAGHRVRGVLAAVGVVAHRGGVFVIRGAAVVDVVHLAGIGDQEGLVGHVGGQRAAITGHGHGADQRGVARRGHVGCPLRAAIAEAVQRLVAGDGLPGQAIVEAGFQVDPGGAVAAGHQAQDLEAADLGAPAGGRVGQQVEADAAAAGGRDVELLDHGLAHGAGLGADVELALHRGAVEHDVELAQARVRVDVVLGEVQAHQVLAVGHRHVPAHALAIGATAVAEALVDALRRRVGDAADIHRFGEAGMAGALRLVDVALPLAQRTARHRAGVAGIDQQHRLGGQQTGRAPLHRHRRAHGQLGKAGRAGHLDQRVGAERGIRRVAEGTLVDAGAIGQRLVVVDQRRIATVHAGGARLQAEIVIGTAVAFDALQAQAVGHDLAEGAGVADAHRQRVAGDDHRAHIAPVDTCVREVARQALQVDAQVVHAVVCRVRTVGDHVQRVAGVAAGGVPGGSQPVGAGHQAGEGVGGVIAAVAGGVAIRLAPVAGVTGGHGGPGAGEHHRRIAVVQHARGAHRGRGPAAHVVGAVGVQVSGCGHPAVQVEAGFVDPVRPAGEVAVLPARQRGAGRLVEQVVVAVVAGLAVGADCDAEGTAAQVQDVGIDACVAGTVDHDGRATGLHDGVVGDALLLGAVVATVHADAVGVVPDQVVAQQAVAIAVHTQGVGIDAVARCHAAAERQAHVVGGERVVLDGIAAEADAGGTAPHGVAGQFTNRRAADAAAGGSPHHIATHHAFVVGRDAGAHVMDAVVGDGHPIARLVTGRVVVDAGGHVVDMVAVDQQPGGIGRVDAVAVAGVVDGVAHHLAVVDVLADPHTRHAVAHHLGPAEREPVRARVVEHHEAIAAAGEGDAVERHAGGVGAQQEGVLARVGVAAVQHRGLVDCTADGDAAVLRVDHDVGAGVVGAGVDQDQVTGLEVVGIQQRLQRCLGLVGTAAVVVVVANGAGVLVAHGRAVVDIEHRHRGRQAERRVRHVEHGRLRHGTDTQQVVATREGAGGRVPCIEAVVGLVGGQALPDHAVGRQVEVDIAGKAV